MPADYSNGPRVLTLAEAARFIRVSEKTLGEMARDKRIPCQKAGREWRFLRQALEDWLSGQGQPKVAEAMPAYQQRELFDARTTPAESERRTSFGDTAFAGNRREPLHRWVPWIAGFSAAFVEHVLEEMAAEPGAGVSVLDPFAGVGTTLLEGVKRGHNVLGFEINPYAALSCHVKLHAHEYDLALLSETTHSFAEFMRAKLRSRTARPKAEPPPGFRSSKPFFSSDVERQVLFVLDFINCQADQRLRDLLKVALGSVMVSFSNYSYEPSLSTRVAAGKSEVLHADVQRILVDKLWEMEADIGFLQQHLTRFRHQPVANIYNRSYLLYADTVPERSIDVLITSPPYLNNYHYIRNTRPQLYWLDLLPSAHDLKAMALESFGKFWQTVRAAPEIHLQVDIAQIKQVVDAVRAKNPEKGVYGGTGWANYAASYFNDCDRFWEVTRALMKPGGSVVVVIGNNILQGVEVKTDEFFAQIGELHGFKMVDSHRVRTKRTGSSILNSSVRAGKTQKRVELYEEAIHLRAPA